MSKSGGDRDRCLRTLCDRNCGWPLVPESRLWDSAGSSGGGGPCPGTRGGDVAPVHFVMQFSAGAVSLGLVISATDLHMGGRLTSTWGYFFGMAVPWPPLSAVACVLMELSVTGVVSFWWPVAMCTRFSLVLSSLAQACPVRGARLTLVAQDRADVAAPVAWPPLHSAAAGLHSRLPWRRACLWRSGEALAYRDG
jgi:hypothetical protein